jgi:hypothetical protein
VIAEQGSVFLFFLALCKLRVESLEKCPSVPRGVNTARVNWITKNEHTNLGKEIMEQKPSLPVGLQTHYRRNSPTTQAELLMLTGFSAPKPVQKRVGQFPQDQNFVPTLKSRLDL